MKTHALLFAAATLALAACQPAGHHADHDGSTPARPHAASTDAATPHRAVEASQGWSRATPPGAAVGGGYVTLRNQADAPDRLLAVESAASARVEIHEMRMEGEVMKMRRLDDGLELPAHATVVLQPGGNHLMFIEPHAPFVVGQPLQAKLVFQNAPPLTVQFEVMPMGAEAPAQGTPMQHMQHMH